MLLFALAYPRGVKESFDDLNTDDILQCLYSCDGIDCMC
jgi:hypothetical protein